MKRRSFVKLAGLGCATLALPALAGGCSSAPGAPQEQNPVFPELPPLDGPAYQVRRFSDAQGNFYDVYALQGRVDFRAPDGALRGRASGLAHPTVVAVDDLGRVLVLERGRERVSAFDPSARRIGAFASGVSLARPSDLAAGHGQIAIADTLHHRVLLVDARTQAARTVGDGLLNGPVSVAFGSAQRLYVADAGSASVHVFGLDGARLDHFSGYGRDPGRLLHPRCLRVDRSGEIHIADAAAGYVSVFDAGHRFVRRFRPTQASGAPGSPLWISTTASGDLLYGTDGGLPA